MFGCFSAGFTMVSNDNTRPTAVCSFPFGVWDGLSFDVGVLDVVGKAVVVVGLVTFTSVWAVDDGAELTAVGALNPSVVVGLLCAKLWV